MAQQRNVEVTLMSDVPVRPAAIGNVIRQGEQREAHRIAVASQVRAISMCPMLVG